MINGRVILDVFAEYIVIFGKKRLRGSDEDLMITLILRKVKDDAKDLMITLKSSGVEL